MSLEHPRTSRVRSASASLATGLSREINTVGTDKENGGVELKRRDLGIEAVRESQTWPYALKKMFSRNSMWQVITVISLNRQC